MIDFLVIGGGIAGASAAARLSELGSVVLLEREDALAYHASGRSAAMFEETYGKPSTIALNQASKDWHLNVNGSRDLPRGVMLIGRAADEQDFDHDLAAMKMHRLTLQEATELLPIINKETVTHVGYHKDAWDVDTDAAVQRYVKMLRSNSGMVITGAEVSKIARTKHGWLISAGKEYSARQIINAAGAWADQIADLAGVTPLGLQPLRRSIARVAAPDGHDVSRWPMLFGPGERWYAKPDAGALLVSPADEEPVEPMDAWADDMTLAEGIARYEEHVTAPVQRMIANWAGLRTFTPDRGLAIGQSEDPSFWWCAGQGGYGFQTAPAACQLLHDLVAGTPSELGRETVEALSPARFKA
ncbi:MAG: FAD-dependent oxidoreductase [Litoreibacter sp.]|uniref:NAD(P)/FAD-dependent oxidoreductase n=1 Tax=Litoreibacter sp. TaxID=1969459 RepID=UPI00329A7C15